jgi:FkbH-like protein
VRRSEEEVLAFSREPGCAVWSYAVTDKFGDNGIVGVAFTRRSGSLSEIDTLLMSCRVIGRAVETAMVAHLARREREAGAARLEGWFHPTAKNAPANGFYDGHGFKVVDEQGAGKRFGRDLSEPLESPPFIAVEESQG